MKYNCLEQTEEKQLNTAITLHKDMRQITPGTSSCTNIHKSSTEIVQRTVLQLNNGVHHYMIDMISLELKHLENGSPQPHMETLKHNAMFCHPHAQVRA